MVELRAGFRSHSEWRAFLPDLIQRTALRDKIVFDVKQYGLREPLTNIIRQPASIKINPKNLRESLSAAELNSRKRALLAQFQIECEKAGWQDRKSRTILSSDGITRVASILRGLFPRFLGTEYIPDSKQQKNFFPIPHCDLQSIPYDADSFDSFIAGDVFEHIPDLRRASCELYRVLRPGGFVCSSFPFSPNRHKSIFRARLDDSGQVEHLLEPEYHGNPVQPDAGSLVFCYPGWDYIEELSEIGFVDVQYSFIASSFFGVVHDYVVGEFILTARKPEEGEARSKSGVYPVVKELDLNWPDHVSLILRMPGRSPALVEAHLNGLGAFTVDASVKDELADHDRSTFGEWLRLAPASVLPRGWVAVGFDLEREKDLTSARHVLGLVPSAVDRSVYLAIDDPVASLLHFLSGPAGDGQPPNAWDLEAINRWYRVSKSTFGLIASLKQKESVTVVASGALPGEAAALRERLASRLDPSLYRFFRVASRGSADGEGGDETRAVPGRLDEPESSRHGSLQDPESLERVLEEIGITQWVKDYSSFHEALVQAGGVVKDLEIPETIRALS